MAFPRVISAERPSAAGRMMSLYWPFKTLTFNTSPERIGRGCAEIAERILYWMRTLAIKSSNLKRLLYAERERENESHSKTILLLWLQKVETQPFYARESRRNYFLMRELNIDI